MTPPELEDLASLWRQEPSADEARLFASLAGRASRRAQAVDRAETGTTLLLSSAIFLYLLANGNATSIAIGGLIILAISWSTWRRHRLSLAARTIHFGTREAMLDSAVESVQASIRRSLIGLVLLVPGFVLGTLLKYSLQNGGRLEGYLAAELSSWSHPRGILSHTIVLVVLIVLVRAHLRLRSELAKLRALRLEYAEEARLDAAE